MKGAEKQCCGSGSGPRFASASICRWQAKMYGIWACLSTFSRVWVFIWKLGSDLHLGEKPDPDPDPHPNQIKIRIRIRIKVISLFRICIQIRIKVMRSATLQKSCLNCKYISYSDTRYLPQKQSKISEANYIIGRHCDRSSMEVCSGTVPYRTDEVRAK